MAPGLYPRAIAGEPDTESAGALTAPAAVKIRRALLSVSDKRGVVDFARGLTGLGIELVSTGGTAAALADAGLEVRAIEDFTGFPEMMDGRVKTLHPRLYAGLLAVRDDQAHVDAASEHDIEYVDLVCVNLYPFERAVAGRLPPAQVIENIDIGGPTMIRAAAKNFAFAAVVTSPESYDAVLDELRGADAQLSMPTRESLAAEAFAYTARYDTAVARWFAEKSEDFPPLFVRAYEKVTDLPYGENPHQRAAYYQQVGSRMHLLSMVQQHHGKQLSFNNLLDLDSARAIVRDFDEPACVILKHNNPCGAAIGTSALEAYERAFATDPLSAFGGVIAFNRPVDAATAERLSEQFVEVLFAPALRARARWRSCSASPRSGSSRTTSGARRWRSSPTSSRSWAACSCRTTTSSSPTARRWRSSPSATRPTTSGATSCSPGRSASRCAPTRSCWRRTRRRRGSGRVR